MILYLQQEQLINKSDGNILLYIIHKEMFIINFGPTLNCQQTIM